MSLDPKYANLPWIAHGQPDVYEAGELPEADQNIQDTFQNTVTPKEIEIVNLSVSEAHKKFASSKVDASNVDFSDCISGSGKIGYAVETNQYDFLPPESRDQESLLKRFQRLQIETNQLIKEIESISDQSEVNPKEPISASKLLSCAEKLSEKLTEIQSTDLTTASLDGSDAIGKVLHSVINSSVEFFSKCVYILGLVLILKPNVRHNFFTDAYNSMFCAHSESTGQRSIHTSFICYFALVNTVRRHAFFRPVILHTNIKILQQIDEFKPEKPMSRKVDESNHLVYEIYDGKSIIQQADAEKLADIDRRIHHIETLIGQPDPNRLSALTADTVTHGLLEACSRLSARSSLFQQGHLDMIEARLTSLQTKLQTVTEKREAIADYDMQNKIAELYELVKKWNDVADSLPMIVERLSTLKSLHEEASHFSQSLGNIESSQKNVEGNLASYTKLLEEVKNNVVKNMEVIKDNFSTIESHFSQEPK
uniref:Dynactin domain-containing protein n=1 Tax=Trichobilharzia regenti TaxID=157069 RepID=A0AA85IKA5_TRIRE|nr:unnamed protein product [Trichobilharzia regenti]